MFWPPGGVAPRRAVAFKLRLDPTESIFSNDCSALLSIMFITEFIFIEDEIGRIFEIFAIFSLQKAKITFERIEFSKCLRKWKSNFIAVLDLKSIFSLVFFPKKNPKI